MDFLTRQGHVAGGQCVVHACGVQRGGLVRVRVVHEGSHQPGQSLIQNRSVWFSSFVIPFRHAACNDVHVRMLQAGPVAP
jgi:hypothetical protein